MSRKSSNSSIMVGVAERTAPAACRPNAARGRTGETKAFDGEPRRQRDGGFAPDRRKVEFRFTEPSLVCDHRLGPLCCPFASG